MGDELDEVALRRLDDHLKELAQVVGMRLMRGNVPLHEDLKAVLNRPVKPDSSVYICGATGTGKTRQLAGAGRELIQLAVYRGEAASPVAYKSLPELMQEMRAGEAITRFDVPWLLLDDVGHPMDYADFINVMQLIDFRYRHELPVIFASPYSFNRLASGAHEGWGIQLASRIMEMCGNRSYPGPDNYITLLSQHRTPRLNE